MIWQYTKYKIRKLFTSFYKQYAKDKQNTTFI